MERLKQFITTHNLKPWDPGTVDCILALSDWLIELNYPDTGEAYRGTYHGDAGYRAMIQKAGCIENLISFEMDLIGVQRTIEPVPGDIGIIGSSRNINRQWGAIWDGHDWQVRGEQGFVAVKACWLSAWDTGGEPCQP